MWHRTPQSMASRAGHTQHAPTFQRSPSPAGRAGSPLNITAPLRLPRPLTAPFGEDSREKGTSGQREPFMDATPM